MKMFCKAVMVGAIVAPLAPAALAQAVITRWDFQNLAVGLNSAPAPSTGAGVATALGMDNTFNANPSQTLADVLSGDPGSSDPVGGTAHRGWRVRGGPVAPANLPANGWSSNAPLFSQGAQFSASTTGFENIVVSYDLFTTTQGVRNWQLQYTVNGTSWINAGSVGQTIGQDRWNNNNTFDFGAAGITGVNDNPLFGIRIVSTVNPVTGTYLNSATVAAPLNNTSGNWRYDMITISGTVIPAPASAVLVAMGMVAAGRRRR